MKTEIVSLSANPFVSAKGFDLSSFTKELSLLSIEMREQITVGETPEKLVDALATALGRSHIIIVVGAANPSMDFSRKTVCDAIGFPTSRNKEVEQRLRSSFERRSEPFTEGAQAQADFPEGATIWEGVSGLTTGFALHSGNQSLIFLPGYGPDLSAMLAVDIFQFIFHLSGSAAAFQEVALETDQLVSAKERFSGLTSDKDTLLSFYLLSKKVCLRALCVASTASQAAEKSSMVMQRALRRAGDIKTFMLPKASAVELNGQIKEYFSQETSSINGFSIGAGASSQTNGNPLEPPEDFKAEKPAKKKDGKRSMSLFRKIMLIICLVCFLASSGYIAWYYYNSFANKKMSESLASMYGGEGSVPEDFPSDYLPAFGVLYGINRDIKGWLEIEGTEVSYPVVQSSDNDYYLRRDFYQNSNDHGVPFLDYRCDVQEPSDNLVIYGHNMRDGQMFGELINYKDLSYYQEHPVIQFDSVYAEGDWKVFAVFRANTLPEHGEVFAYHSFINGDKRRGF